MKKIEKGKLLTLTRIDGVERSRIETKRTIYLCKGKRMVHYVSGYREVTKLNDDLYLLTIDIKTHKVSYKISSSGKIIKY